MSISLKGQLVTIFLLTLFVVSNGVVSTVLADEPPHSLDVIRQAAADYFPYEQAQYHMSAENLFELLHDGDPANDPLIVSVQTRDEYELGHIPGAINIPWDELTDVAQLQAQIPKDQPTVLYCNRAVYSAQISAIMNLLGYNTLDLAYGFEGWTQNPVAIPDHFDPDCVCEHAVDTEVHTTEPSYIYPPLNLQGATPQEIITAAANAYLGSEKYFQSTICPCDLEDILVDDDPTNNPFVLSLQWPEGYATGHIPTAVNIPRWNLFQPENISHLPADRPIAICCYLGFTSTQVAAILNMMGYDVQVTLHGLSAWTLDPQIAHFRIDDPRSWRDYPIEGTATELAFVPSPTVTDVELPVGVALPVVEAPSTAQPAQVDPVHLPESGGVPLPFGPILVVTGLVIIILGITGNKINRKF